ncbi:MAG: D-inositol-3-phosphate glycosyltransferase [Ornithinimicrobium sp.]
MSLGGAAGVNRVAMISVHTSPLDQPGSGDAGGLNVYVVETARRLAARGTQVEIFTRATDGGQADVAQLDPDGLGDAVLVHHVPAGPFEGLDKDDLPGQLCAFAAGMMRTAASRPEHWYDLVHSHYWLSGQVAWLAADRWNVPLVHTMHTMARVKNQGLASGDVAEPRGREIGEEQVVQAATTLVANTEQEASELIELYAADPAKVRVVHPGVDTELFTPGDAGAARDAVGVATDAVVLLFVGRIQPLKAPDVVVRAAAQMIEADPGLRGRLVVAVLGGLSGAGVKAPLWLGDLATELGIADVVRFVPPTSRATLAQWYRAADITCVPSYNESFGLVAVEALASGSPVLAARVGGLPIAVGPAGMLVDGHEPGRWAEVMSGLLADPQRRQQMTQQGPEHARQFSWEHTVDALEQVYADAIAGPESKGLQDAQLLDDIPSALVP